MKQRDLCPDALLAIELAKKENLPRTAQYIENVCAKYEFSYKAIVKEVFVCEVGERFVGKETDNHTKEEAGKEPAAELLINIGNPKWIYWFSKYVTGVSARIMDKFTEIIANTNDSYQISSFASDISSLSDDNKKHLARIILKSKNPGSATNFAKYVHGISLDLKLCFADIVLESKNPEWAYFFAVGVTGMSDKLIEELAETVINSKNPRFAFLFAKFLYMRMSRDVLNKLISVVENGKDGDLGYFQGRSIKDLCTELTKQFK